MTDGPIDRGTGKVRDNDGTTYDIEGDRAVGGPGEPRDVTSGYPTGAFVAGGAGGTGTLGAVSAAGPGSATSASESGDVHPTSGGDTHSSVAEAADLGQRPLRDYGNDGDGAATDTAAGSSDPAAASSGAAAPRRDSITMSNQTPIGSTANETITDIHVGYKVVDASGDEIGKVCDLRSGDTQASTTGPDDPEDRGDVDTSARLDGPGVIGIPGAAGTGGTSTGGTGLGGAIPVVAASSDRDRAPFGDDEPNVDEPAYTRLVRTGFIKVDAKGWFSSDRYAGADQIDRVEGETVYLNAGKDDLIRER